MYIKKIDFQIDTLKDFSKVIDVRSPDEFYEDNIPTSLNYPVLNNSERRKIGEIYKSDVFEARRKGAEYVTKNIYKILKQIEFYKNDAILIYCWRGGMRSLSLYMVLKSIGYNVAILEKGYKGYRKYINSFFNTEVKKYHFNILNGLTGTGKTFFLAKLSKYSNVLNIEQIAKHKGSILGDLPNINQPSQKKFESKIWYSLMKFEYKENIWIESESNRIGRLFIPNNLFKKMKLGKVFKIEMSVKDRINFIMQDYKYLIEDEKIIRKALKVFEKFISKKEIEKIKIFLENKNFKMFVESLLLNHYDRVYQKRNIYKKTNKVINLKSVNSASFKVLLQSIKT